MKKILFILLTVLIISSVTIARADEAKSSQRRAQLVQHYLGQNPGRANRAEQFLGWVEKGNLQAIAGVKDISLLSAKDKFGNNCFHLAKDAATLQTLAGVVRRLAPEEMNAILTRLRNERNEMNETPLMAHVSYGRADTFFLLYKGSDLQLHIQQAQAVDKGGALSQVADIRKGVVVAMSKDMSGRTVAQAALANSTAPGMDRVIRFFQERAPYLF